MVYFGGFEEGAVIEVVGLQKKQQLNGLRGEVLCTQGDRLVVRLPTGDTALRPENCLSPSSGQSRKRKAESDPTGAAAKKQAGQTGYSEEMLQLQLQQQLQQQQLQQLQQQQLQQPADLSTALLMSQPSATNALLQSSVLQLLQLKLQQQNLEIQLQSQLASTRSMLAAPENSGRETKKSRRQQQQAHGAAPAQEKPRGCCLLVVLRGASGDADADDLFWVFSQFGLVEKVSLFSKDTNHQALIQYQAPAEAQVAMGYLNGQSLTVGSCGCAELAIMLSSHVQLTFPKPDQRNREYSVINKQLKAAADYPEIEAIAATNGWALRDFLWGKPIPGREGWLLPKQAAEHKGRIPKPSSNHVLGKVGDCILLSGLKGDKISAKKLWGVVGMYGKVVAVKILQRRNDCALIQYASEDAASTARAALDQCELYGVRLDVKRSKHANALNWRGAKSGLERFMCTSAERAPPQSYPEAGPPTSALIVHDVPKDVLEDECALEKLVAAFGEYGSTTHTVEGGRLKVQLADTEHAFSAACNLNGTKISSGQHTIELKLQFPWAS